MKNLYSKALTFATKAHAGQKRMNGDNYIIHPIRVSMEVKTEVRKVVALLHDVLEDTASIEADISREFGEEIAKKVLILTHKKDEPYNDYITRVLADQDCIVVKIADICDNLADSPTDKAVKKLSTALTRLVIHTI